MIETLFWILAIGMSYLLVLWWSKLMYRKMHRCFSSSCSHNSKGHCGLNKIFIYDNVVQGICLWHSNSIETRTYENLLHELPKFKENQDSILAIENPNLFVKWIKRHWKKEE